MSEQTHAGEVRLGVDVVDIVRFGQVCARQPRLVERVFTVSERSECHGKIARLAARFAAKEAVMKLLGVGLGAVDFSDIEVRTKQSGEPTLSLSGRAERLAGGFGIGTPTVSLTHSQIVAIAVVAAVPRDLRHRKY